ncbi:MAG TPA: four helix bundle protein [Acidobacteriaceae bacterium]|nr:four helix bundle protein [Acidobacteriaceae bacterium]
MGQSFRDLIVWQRSIELTAYVYELSTGFPKSEVYGLTSQIRRAAVSIASNIAEGTGRGTKKEFTQFLNVARGSNCELQAQLIIAAKLQMASQDQLVKAETLSHEVGRMLNGLLLSLRPTGD